MDVLPTKLWAGAAAFEEMTHGRAVDDTRSVYVWGLRDAAATMREAKAALSASAARIEALTEALQRIADRFQKNGEDLHSFINATRDIARAALTPEDRT